MIKHRIWRLLAAMTLLGVTLGCAGDGGASGPAVPSLSTLTLSEGVLSTPFAPQQLAYVVIVEESVAAVTVSVTATDPDADVRINATVVASVGGTLEIPLSGVENPISIVVTSPEGAESRPYQILVVREPSRASCSSLGDSDFQCWCDPGYEGSPPSGPCLAIIG